MHYNFEDLLNGIRGAGITAGDVVFSHVALEKLGILEDTENRHPAEMLLDAFSEVLGPRGTLLTPAFSYSFCRGEKFCVKTAPSAVGAFGNYIIKNKRSCRSHDPIFSILGIGPAAGELFHELPCTSFGDDCLFDRLTNRAAKICNIGMGHSVVTGLHHFEFKNRVCYRYDKKFCGTIIDERGIEKNISWTYYVRANVPETIPNVFSIENQLLRLKYSKQIKVGCGIVAASDFPMLSKTLACMLDENPWSLVQGPPIDVEKLNHIIACDLAGKNQV